MAAILDTIVIAWAGATTFFSVKNTNQLTKSQKNRMRWMLALSAVGMVCVCIGMAFGMGVAAGLAIVGILAFLNIGHYLYYRKFYSELSEDKQNSAENAKLVADNDPGYFKKLLLNDFHGVDQKIKAGGVLHWVDTFFKKITFRKQTEYRRTALIKKYQEYHDKLLDGDTLSEDEDFLKQLITCVPARLYEIRHLCMEDSLGRNILHYLCMDPDPKRLFSKEQSQRAFPTSAQVTDNSEWLYRQNVYFLKMILDRYNSIFFNRKAKTDHPLENFLEKKDSSGMTPLAYATTAYLYGHVCNLSLIQKLLEYGADSANKIGNIDINVLEEEVPKDKETIVSDLSSRSKKPNKDEKNFSPMILALKKNNKENNADLVRLFIRVAIKNDTKKLPISYKVKRFFWFFWNQKNIKSPIKEYTFKMNDIVEFIETILSGDEHKIEPKVQADYLKSILKYAGVRHANYQVDTKQYVAFIEKAISKKRWDLVEPLLSENIGCLQPNNLLDILKFSISQEDVDISLQIINFIKQSTPSLKKVFSETLSKQVEELFFESLKLNSSKLLDEMTYIGAKVSSFVNLKYLKAWEAKSHDYLHGRLPSFNQTSNIPPVEIEWQEGEDRQSQEFIVEWFLKHIPPNLQGSCATGIEAITRTLLPQEEDQKENSEDKNKLPYWIRFAKRLDGTMDENRLTGDYKNLLHLAMGSGNTAAVCCLILDLDAKTAVMLLREPDAKGLTPLHYAAKKGFHHCISQMFTLLFNKLDDKEENAKVFSELIFDTYDKSGKNVLHTLLESSEAQASDDKKNEFSRSLIKEYYAFVLELKDKRRIFRKMLKNDEEIDLRKKEADRQDPGKWPGVKIYDRYVKNQKELEDEVIRFFIKNHKPFQYVMSQVKFHDFLRYIIDRAEEYGMPKKLSQESLSGKNALHYLMSSKNILKPESGETLFDLLMPYCTLNPHAAGKIYIELKPKKHVEDQVLLQKMQERRKVLHGFFTMDEKQRIDFEYDFNMPTVLEWVHLLKPSMKGLTLEEDNSALPSQDVQLSEDGSMFHVGMQGGTPLEQLECSSGDQAKEKVIIYYRKKIEAFEKDSEKKEKVIQKNVSKITEFISELSIQDVIVSGVIFDEHTKLESFVNTHRSKIESALEYKFFTSSLGSQEQEKNQYFLDSVLLVALCQFAIPKKDPRLLDFLLVKLEALRRSKRADKKEILKTLMGSDLLSVENLLLDSLGDDDASEWNMRALFCLSTIDKIEDTGPWDCNARLHNLFRKWQTQAPQDPLLFLKQIQVCREGIDLSLKQENIHSLRLSFYEKLYFDGRDIEIHNKIKTKLTVEYSKIKVKRDGFKLISGSYDRFMGELQKEVLPEVKKPKTGVVSAVKELFKIKPKTVTVYDVKAPLPPQIVLHTQKLPLIQYLLFAWLDFSEENSDLTESVLMDISHFIEKWRQKNSPFYNEYMILVRTTNIISGLNIYIQKACTERAYEEEKINELKQWLRTPADPLIDSTIMNQKDLEKNRLAEKVERTKRIIEKLENMRALFLKYTPLELAREKYLKEDMLNFPVVSFEEQLNIWCQLMRDFGSKNPEATLRVLLHQQFFKDNNSFFVEYQSEVFKKQEAVLRYFITLRTLIHHDNTDYGSVVLAILKDLTILITEKKSEALANIQKIENKKNGIEAEQEKPTSIMPDSTISPKKGMPQKKRSVTDAAQMQRLSMEQDVDKKVLVAIKDFLKEIDELQGMWHVVSESESDVDSHIAATETSATIDNDQDLLSAHSSPLPLDLQLISIAEAPPPVILRPSISDAASVAETASQASEEEAPLLRRSQQHPSAGKKRKGFLEMFGWKRKASVDTRAQAAPVRPIVPTQEEQKRSRSASPLIGYKPD